MAGYTELEERERWHTSYPPPSLGQRSGGQSSRSCLPPLLQGLCNGDMDEGTETHTLEHEYRASWEKRLCPSLGP